MLHSLRGRHAHLSIHGAASLFSRNIRLDHLLVGLPPLAQKTATRGSISHTLSQARLRRRRPDPPPHRDMQHEYAKQHPSQSTAAMDPGSPCSSRRADTGHAQTVPTTADLHQHRRSAFSETCTWPLALNHACPHLSTEQARDLAGGLQTLGSPDAHFLRS